MNPDNPSFRTDDDERRTNAYREKIKELTRIVELQKAEYNDILEPRFIATIEELEAKLKYAVSVLQYYAEPSTWGNGCAAVDPSDTYHDYTPYNTLRGGGRAKAAIEKIGKI